MKTILTIILALCISLPASAVPGKYERKSISYLNALWITGKSAHDIKQAQLRVLLNDVKTWIEIDRFDYNPLPDTLIRDFADRANTQDDLTTDDLASLMQTTLVPKIVEILNAESELRARGMLSEESRQSFLATKAKESGVTLEELTRVMNSAYIYLPYLSSYKPATKKRPQCEIKGGIIWFKVFWEGDTPRVTFKAKTATESIGFGDPDEAYRDASMNFCRNLQKATREIDEFTLSASLTEIIGRSVSFKLGSKEGVGLDDLFLVGGWETNSKGETKFNTDGWVRVSKVGDNRKSATDRSEAATVSAGGFAVGMTAIEHPQLGIDVAFRPTLFRTKVSTGEIPLVLSGWTGAGMKITEAVDGYSPGAELGFQINTAKLSKVSQLYFLLGVHAALPLVKFEVPDDPAFVNTSTSLPYIVGGSIGMMRKFYLGRWALTGDARLGYTSFNVTQKFSFHIGPFSTEDYTYTVKNEAVGLRADLGVEFAATPDVNWGFEAGYQLFGSAQSLDISYKDEDGKTQSVDTELSPDYPTISHSGPVFAIYVHISPRELPFDPLSFINAVASGATNAPNDDDEPPHHHR